ncbi:sodium/potassium/calcium exchanger 6, mitochondrial [Elysia marginata]|uniref:Sodium/potassium/calcium exchanger 6, mitochondrial n=1 Tax=Elysia marginata TaxID=1093978 RepID=A0AAV4H7K6_9GAST|nr:sodium/potassium/calcium exchanger 6, mitochondrial [Elysia marginata]
MLVTCRNNRTVDPCRSTFLYLHLLSTECDRIHSVQNLSDRCWFVRHTASCDIDEGFVNYTRLLYCVLEDIPVWFGCVLLVLWWLFMFSGLAVTADDLSVKYNLSGRQKLLTNRPSGGFVLKSVLYLRLEVNQGNFLCKATCAVASVHQTLDSGPTQVFHGVTFLAFGNGAPDVFSAVAAIGNAKAGDAGLAIGALFGAGVFVTAVVAGSIAIIRPFKCMERPLMRDVIFYLAATYWAWLIMWDKKITQAEAAVQSHDPLLRSPVDSDSNSERANTANRHSYDSTSPTVRGADDIMHAFVASSDSTVSVSSSDGILSSRGNISAGSPNIQVEIEAVSRSRHRHLSRTEEVQDLLRIFLAGVNPINTEEWAELGLHWKIYEVFKCPIVLCLKLTVPVVDDEEEKELVEEETYSQSDSSKDDDTSDVKELIVSVDKENQLRNWNRPLNSLQIFLGLFFASIATGVGTKTLGGTFPVYVLVLIVGAALAIFVFITTSTDKRPRFHTGLAYLGFVVAVVWIYCIANEIVNILQALGVAFNLSDAILGLTFLAWGNSIGDLIADTSMARQGYPRMGISACFGGPLFNMLIGLGIPFSIACAENGGVFELKVSLEEMVLAGGLGLSLVSTLIIVPLSKFHMSRPYGIYLLVLYAIFLLIAILTEVNIIENISL